MKKLSALSIFTIIVVSIFSFGCGKVTQTTPDNLPVSIIGLDGAVDVPVDSSFLYNFSQPIDQSTVSTSTFFIIDNSTVTTSESTKATLTSICDDPTNAQEATTACHFSEYCILDPTYDLESGSIYTVCLTRGIHHSNGAQFEGYQATFTAGSDSSSLSVTSAIDADDNDLSTTTEGINPTSFDLTFSTEMDETSLTTEGGVTFECELPSGSSLAQPTVTVAASESAENAFTVTITDADGNTPYRYQLLDCVLTVTTNVTNSSGTELSEATVYNFTNGCALADDFNADSQSCWGVYDTTSIMQGVGGYSDWTGLLANTGVFAFDTAGSALDYSSVNTSENITMGQTYKETEVDSSGFEIVAHFSSASGFADSPDSLNVGLHVDEGIPGAPGQDAGRFITLGLGSDGSVICIATYGESGAQTSAAAFADCSSFNNMYIKVTVSNSAMTVAYAGDDQVYTEFAAGDFVLGSGWPQDQDFTDTQYMSITATDQNNDNVAAFGYVMTTGISSTSQY